MLRVAPVSRRLDNALHAVISQRHRQMALIPRPIHSTPNVCRDSAIKLKSDERSTETKPVAGSGAMGKKVVPASAAQPGE